MNNRFNPLNFDSLFSEPRRVADTSYWKEHIPFGMWLVSVLKPQVLVELGTYYGDSYCAFCQAVEEQQLGTRCYSVDVWKGDVSTNEYTKDLFEDLRKYHDDLYNSFSELLICSPEEALSRFEDGAIDLLHIDGAHTYHAIRQSFESWLPKVSRRGVVLIHNTNTKEHVPGVKLYFDEIKLSYSYFEFLCGYGLSMVIVGEGIPVELEWLVNLDVLEAKRVRQYFHQQGKRLQLEAQTRILTNEIEKLRPRVSKVERLEQELKRMEKDAIYYQSQIRTLLDNLNLIATSKGWSLLQTLWGIKRRLLPRGEQALSTQSQALSTQSLEVADTIDMIDTIDTDAHAKENGDSPQPKAWIEIRARAQADNADSDARNNRSIAADKPPAGQSMSQDALIRLTDAELRLIAFYLPQFYPIPENDRWWGKGFTEWTNVTKARPNFLGHYQPHLPADLGFYDLRVQETREQQAQLAREYGIYGFCYYHYWLGGKRLLNRPIDELLRSGQPDFPFCLCWTNHNWNRSWDGLENEVLIAQTHSDEDDRRFITSLFAAFEDHRYVRIDNKPLLLVYYIDLLPNAAKTVEVWREECHRAGVGEIYICAVLAKKIEDPRPYGFDAAVEFPPNGGLVVDRINHKVELTNPHFEGSIVDYPQAADFFINKPETDYVLLRSVMTSWDNTARRQNNGLIFLNSSPEAYEGWLRKTIELTLLRNKGDERVVFINAWNEWAEGAHLEPDRKFGHQFLQATLNSVHVAPQTHSLLS